jgi:hypothetical protein
MAAPLVSGSLALRLQVAPGSTISDLQKALEDTAAPLVGEEGSIWEGKLGDGRIDAAALVAF